MQEEQVGWVNQQEEGSEEIFTSSGSDEYMIMSIMKKNSDELKTPSARIQAKVSGKKMWLWVYSGCPVTIFSMTDLKEH